MKAIKNLKLITLMLIALNVSGAQLTSNSKVVTNETIDRSIDKEVKLVIKNAQGDIIYQGDGLTNLDHLVDFDLNILPDGSYTMELETPMMIEIKSFKVLKSVVKFNDSQSIFKPVVSQRGRLVYVSKMAFDTQTFKIEIFGYNGELLHQEVQKNTQLKGRIFDFSSIEDDKFKIVVRADGRIYKQFINL